MSRLELNLARRPFLNSRPVVRLTVLMWALGALLLAANLWLYGHYWVGSGEKARRLSELEASIAAERAAGADLARRLAGFDLGQQNATVGFLNRKLAERAFSWGLLLDRLAEVQPADARLTALSREGGSERADAAAAAAGEDSPSEQRVRLKVVGEAKTDEALLELVDAFFAHPSFRSPDLEREARQEGHWLRFDLQVTYLPGAPVPEATTPSGASGGPESAEGEEEAAGQDGRGPAGADEEEVP